MSPPSYECWRYAHDGSGTASTAELDVAVNGNVTVREAEAIASEVERQLLDHISALSIARVRVRPAHAADHGDVAHGHHHAPDPVPITGKLAEGVLEISDTPEGERFRFTAACLWWPAPRSRA